MPDLVSVLSLTPHSSVENQDGHATGDRDTDHILSPGLEELELYRGTFIFTRRRFQSVPGVTLHHLFDAISIRNDPQGRLTII